MDRLAYLEQYFYLNVVIGVYCEEQTRLVHMVRQISLKSNTESVPQMCFKNEV